MPIGSAMPPGVAQPAGFLQGVRLASPAGSRYGDGVARRYAILDDNQRLLEALLDQLGQVLPPLIATRACAALVIGSVAAGRARDQSDVDLLLVLRSGTPQRADYRWWDSEVAPRLGLDAQGRFPIAPLIVARTALATTEPHLRRALAEAIAVWDPLRVLDDQRQAVA
jgi:predicted nucleotidyltransferase